MQAQKFILVNLMKSLHGETCHVFELNSKNLQTNGINCQK